MKREYSAACADRMQRPPRPRLWALPHDPDQAVLDALRQGAVLTRVDPLAPTPTPTQPWLVGRGRHHDRPGTVRQKSRDKTCESKCDRHCGGTCCKQPWKEWRGHSRGFCVLSTCFASRLPNYTQLLTLCCQVDW